MADVTVANTAPGIAGKTLACHDADGTTSGIWTFTNPPALKGGPTANQTWRLSVQGSGDLLLVADGIGGGLRLSTTGAGIFTGNISDYSRTTPLGHWIDVPFDAANFGGGAGTWTVAAGQVTTNRYTLIGKTLIWLIYLTGGTVGGSTNQLKITLPAGLIAASAAASRLAQVNDAGGGVEAIALSGIGSNQLSLQKTNFAAWAAGALTILLATVTLDIQ